MSSDAELDAKLTELLRVMVNRLPPNKKLPTAVVQQLLRTKYGETYPEAYVQSHESFIADTILRLAIEKEKRVMAATAGNHTSSSAAASSSDAASEEDEEEESEEEEEYEEEVSDSGEDEEASEDSEVDGESDDDNLDSEEEDDSEDEEEDEPDRKKPRQEELDATAKKEQQEQVWKTTETNGEASSNHNHSTTVTLAERCKAMAECLRKLSYRVRAPSEAETLEDYLRNFLIAEFRKHEMDPERYSKSDIKRYRIKREVELLQQDGASLSLDRRNRAGRGFSNVVVSPNGGAQTASLSSPASKQTSMFLDDE